MKRLFTEISVLALAVACGGDGGGGPGPDDPDAGGGGDDFDRPALLANVATNIVLPVYQRFGDDVAALGTAVTAYCTALETPDEAARRTDAQAAFGAAMDSWQLAEAMLIGPAAPADGAQRDAVYSWPIVSACAVDQDVVLALENASYDIATRLPNRRGLAAVEYLLFQDSLESLCTPATAPPSWAGMDAAERRAARCAFVAIVAADLAVTAGALVDAWLPDGEFAASLTSAGSSGSTFETETDALNVVFGSLFYVDLMVKNQKVQEPAGLRANSCGTTDEPCLAEIESTFSARGVANLRANLDGFEMLFLGRGVDGEDGLGFDEFLRALGGEAIADGILADLAATRTALDALPLGMEQALEDSYSTVVEAAEGLTGITEKLKHDAPPVLQLAIPEDVAGDTD